MVTIQKKLTPYNYTIHSNKSNKYIVIHYVGSVSTAKNNADYYASRKLDASAHYFVDETSIWQSVDDSNASWHCGGGLQGSGGHTFYQKCLNSNSIGIEMCVKKTSGGKWYFEEETVKNTIDLVKHLMKKHNIPIARVIRHYDVTGKLCPGIIGWNEDSGNVTEWKHFQKRISGGTTPKTDDKTDTQKKQIYRVRKTATDAKTQIGAFTVLDNAKKLADKNIGYKVFDVSGNVVYTPK